MSGVITDFFKPKDGAKTVNNRKRKLCDEESSKTPEPSVSTDTTAATTDVLSEPSKKRIKLNSQESKEESVESISEAETEAEADAEQENKDPAVEKVISFANCDELMNESWQNILASEFKKPYFIELRKKLQKEHSKGVEIFPPLPMVFRAFDLCEWDDLKAVILGQDPYHDDHQAEGLCFSVQKGVKIPSSLRNMMKEAAEDVGFQAPGHGSLIEWGKQGVLLLNTVLTVQAHKANSHKKFGWQQFTDAVIRNISEKHDGVVFILWGKQAQNKKKLINVGKHKIIESPHPSGLSAHRGYFGSKPYSKCNEYLKELGKQPIDWQISQ